MSSTEWTTEAKECFDQLRHATALLDAAQLAQWQRPTQTPVLPDRGIVGATADPTGDTVADTRRISLRDAVQALLHDPRRQLQWADIIEHSHKLLENDSYPYRAPRPGVGVWRQQRDPMLITLADTARHVGALAESQPRPIRRLASDLRATNLHFEQRIRRVSIAYRRYDNQTNDPWSQPQV